MVKRWPWLVISAVLLILSGFAVGRYVHVPDDSVLSPKGDQVKELPYAKYSLANLAKRNDVPSAITISGDKFYYQSENRRISGQIHMPSGSRPVGVIVMARGYVDKEIYQTGVGTKNAASYYASHGYLTLAPDFSGYGESDPEDPDAMGARLVKPVEILDLLASVATWEQTRDLPVFLWGHSNGGQIMLTVAEAMSSKQQAANGIQQSQIKGLILWAPVSAPFPYSILYYTDEASDSGKWLRSQVSRFEQDYDVFDYSIDHYLDKINLPVQLHQGTMDESVPKKWSDELAKGLKNKGKIVSYYVYPGADHNLRPSWDTVVARDVQWMDKLRLGGK